MGISVLPALRRPGFLPPLPKEWDQLIHEAQSYRPPLPPAKTLGLLGRSIRAALGDKWYVLGKTKTGKTTFTKRLIREYRTLYPFLETYIYDGKGARGDFASWPGQWRDDDPPSPLRTPGAIQVWLPPGDDDPDAIEQWLSGILKRREPALVVCDELSNWSRSPIRADYPASFAKIEKQGALLGIGMAVHTQEAAYNPRSIKTQASHLVRFGLQEDDHAARQAARLLGHAEPREPRTQHGFFHRDLDTMGPAWEYADYRDFF